jgi:Fur family transcriptional regulator, iron response regulator
MQNLSATALQQRLQNAGILPTLQRMTVASVLLPRPVHMTAEQVLLAARVHLPSLSRATVYAVLQLFSRQGLLKELPVEGAAVVYDSNTAPHHHLYDVDTGEVADLPEPALQVLGLPAALGAMELAGVDVIIRVRGLKAGLHD